MQTPLYMQMAEEIATQIEKGDLLPGAQLPPQRDFAYARGVTTGTVLRAYAELQRRGLIESTVGRGSFVRKPAVGTPPADETDLRANRPPLRSFAQELLKSISRDPARFDEAFLTDRMLPSNVQQRHEDAAARWLQRYHAVEPNPPPLLCGSSQNGLASSLLTLCKPGDTVVTEETTYNGVIMLCNMLHLRLLWVPIDTHGLLPDALAAVCRRERPKVLFCMPNLHSPTTATMSAQRRRKVVALARKHDFYIVQDDAYGAYLDPPPEPFRTLAPERSILFTSLTKVVALGAAGGILSAPKELRDQLATNIRLAGATVNPVCWEALAHWMQDGRLDEVIAQNRGEIRVRAALAHSLLGEVGLLSRPDCPHAFLPLPPSTTLSDFMIAAQHHGLKLMRSDQFAVEPAAATPAGVRISLGAAHDRPTLSSALTKIRHILQLSAAQVPIT